MNLHGLPLEPKSSASANSAISASRAATKIPTSLSYVFCLPMYHIIFLMFCQRPAFLLCTGCQSALPICLITFRLTLVRKIAVIVKDITSAIGKAHHTEVTSPVRDKR